METVTVKILTTQTVEGETTRLKTLAKGEFSATQHAYLLQYDQTEDGVLTHTRLTVDKITNQVVMERNGTITIAVGQSHTAPYRMGPYEMDLTVTGKQVLCRLHAQGGSLKMHYELSINGTPAGETTVELFVKK